MASAKNESAFRQKLVLIVDDDAEIRTTLSQLLVKEGYSVLEAMDGKLAIPLIERHRPDAVISDIKMPHMDGLALLESVRKIGSMPFILMTGFSQVMETQEAQKRGATDFILKPFKREEILAMLEHAIERSRLPNTSPQPQGSAPQPLPGDEEETIEIENLDLDYCRLSIDEFVAGRLSLADIFVRLTEKKYIKVARKDSDLSIERIQAYKDKGLSFLYIRKEDFARYIGLNLELTKIVGSKKTVSKSQRFCLMKHTSEILLQDVYINGANKERLQSSAALVEAMVSSLSEDPQIFDLLTILQTHSDHLYAHSLGVALYSSMLAKEVGWTSAPTLFKISMGGLLHDIGKKEIPRAILEKPRQNLTSDERLTFETHPIRGKEILSLIRSIPEDVAQISMHHHENAIGGGFPYRLNKLKIHPLSRLITVANEFCDLALKSPGLPEPLCAHDAITRLYSLKGQELDLTFLRAFMKVFAFPIPDGMPRGTLPQLN